ncbi:MAG: M23 family metallopeptidase [Brumimicrobium sp.]|nr:M23 family metallopeptidase [Brumimicrobium sp.]
MKKPRKKKKRNWFRKSIRIVGMNPHSFEEWWRIKINNIQIISVSLILFVLLLILSYVIFSYTPIGYLLPETVKDKDRIEIESAAVRVNDLEIKLASQDKYITNLQLIILGKIPIDSIYTNEPNDSLFDEGNIKFDTTSTEAERELNRNIKLQIEARKNQKQDIISHLFLFDPISGEISQKFKKPEHIGVDVVAPKDTQIKSCSSGTVIHSSYDTKDGFTIIISHENNLISVYKHAKTSFAKVGDHVNTGEVIGIIGNSGERSSGTHLHFELWSDMGPVDPLEYFSFGK